MIGKFLERLIKGRLEEHWDKNGRTNDKQFESSKEKSTTNVISKVIEIFERKEANTLYYKEICILVVLDV